VVRAALDVRVLELIAAGAPLPEILETIVLGMEAETAGMRGSVLLLEDGVRVRHGAAPHLPDRWIREVDGREIGPREGSCGTAAWTRKPAIASDIATDPRWLKYRDVALACGLSACWSVPFFGADGQVLGTFAQYYRRRRKPTARELARAKHAGHLAAIAVQRHRNEVAVRESEATARMIVDHALDANVVIDTSGVITAWNPRATALFGWTAAEAVGRSLSSLIVPPGLAGEHENGLRRFAETGEGTILGRRVEMQARHRDGRTLHVVLAITPIRRGDRTMFSAFIEDVTDTRRTAEALRESQRHLALVYDHVADVLFELQVEPAGFRFSSVNPAFLKSTGLPAAAVLGRFVHEVIPEPSRGVVLERYTEAIRTRQTVRWEEVTAYPTGTRVGDVAVTPVFDAQGNVTHLIGSVRDLTERRQMENEVRQLQKLEAIGRLSGGIAHDFNNILAVILGVGNLLTRDLEDPAHKAQLEEMLAAGQRGAKLTRQFLAFARKQVLQPKPLDLSETVRELEPLIARLLRADITLDLKLRQGLRPVLGDPSQLEQVVMNLAVNARDAMPRGGTLTIQVDEVPVDDRAAERLGITPGVAARLTVIDTGEGMTAETRRRIFEPFFTTKEPGKGTGLGLATVYGIVKQSGGAIDVESAPGQGATFRIILPLADEHAVAARERGTQRDSWGRGLAGTKILLVEDEPALRAAFSRMLERLNCEVAVAANGEEALALVENGKVSPDLLITDTVIPGLSGTELARRLTAAHPGLKVLRMSGYADPEINKAEDHPAPGTFLQKPFTIPEFAEGVQRALNS